MKNYITRNFFIISFFLVIGIERVIAQGDFRKGYILTNSLDSIPGLVDYRPEKKNKRVCFFRKERRDRTVIYNPGEIKAYGFYDDKRYESKTIKINNTTRLTVFAQLLVSGTMSLYKYGSVYYIQLDTLTRLPPVTQKLIETEKGKQMRSDFRYKGLLNYFMWDCRLSADRISYDERPLINLVQNFNRCKGGAGLVFKENKPDTKFDFQIFGGYDVSNLRLEGFKEEAFQKSNSGAIGLSVDFSSPRLFDRVFFSIEAWHLKKKYQGYLEYAQGTSNIEHNDYIFDISFVKMPVGLRYNLWKDTHTPYLKLGFVPYFITQSSTSIVTERQFGGQVFTSYYQGKFEDKNPVGLWVSLGFCQIIQPKFKGFLELRYERTNGFIQYSTTTNLNLIVGIRF